MTDSSACVTFTHLLIFLSNIIGSELLGLSFLEETERYAHHYPEDLHDKVSNLDNIYKK
ncbi:MAG: hypothetical protein Q8933_15480 [Bacteroidota bacterium]|nr:hypothetical protein [Bacteroidota bacterium]MDP4196458.1 hypothetical protein [Bacteroidota bacterium]